MTTTAQTQPQARDTAAQSGGFPLRAINTDRDPRDLLRDVAEAAAAAAIFS